MSRRAGLKNVREMAMFGAVCVAGGRNPAGILRAGAVWSGWMGFGEESIRERVAKCVVAIHT